MQTALPDTSHLSDSKRALLERRLRGRTDIVERNEPPAPDALIFDENARHDPVPMRAFTAERTRYATAGQADYRLVMETRKTGLVADAYEAAWKELSRVTDALRTRVRGDKLLVLPEDTPFEVIRHDLRSCFDDKQRIALVEGVRARMERMAAEPDAPSGIVAIVQVSDDEFRCFYSFDLRVFDLPSVEFMALRCRRIYEGSYSASTPLHLADYRRTEEAWLASADGQDARRHWDRKLQGLPERLTGQHLAPSSDETGYGYLCINTPKDLWLEGQKIAVRHGVSELMAVQVLFTDLLSHLAARKCLTYETRSFQRLPLHPDIYELLGQFTLGSLTGCDDSAPATFVERVRAEQERVDKSAPFAFFDVASHWQAKDTRGAKVVFTNTCNRFEEFVLAGNVPPMRWFGEYLSIQQHNPDTALEYVLVENAGDLENHWFLNHAILPRSWAQEAHSLLCDTLERLCTSPDLWTEPSLFRAKEPFA
jgi:hypothetical protein